MFTDVSLLAATKRHTLTTRKANKTCDRINCPMSYTGYCFMKGVAYQVKCLKCHKCYFGSTIRLIHDGIREHLGNINYSVLKHLVQCQLDRGDVDEHIIARNKDPVNIRLLEALNIRTFKPDINSREECAEFRGLLF